MLKKKKVSAVLHNVVNWGSVGGHTISGETKKPFSMLSVSLCTHLPHLPLSGTTSFMQCCFPNCAGPRDNLSQSRFSWSCELHAPGISCPGYLKSILQHISSWKTGILVNKSKVTWESLHQLKWIWLSFSSLFVPPTLSSKPYYHAYINTARGNLKRCAVFWRVGDACIPGRSCLQEGPAPHSEAVLGPCSAGLVVAHNSMNKEWLIAGLCPDLSVPRFFWLWSFSDTKSCIHPTSHSNSWCEFSWGWLSFFYHGRGCLGVCPPSALFLWFISILFSFESVTDDCAFRRIRDNDRHKKF